MRETRGRTVKVVLFSSIVRGIERKSKLFKQFKPAILKNILVTLITPPLNTKWHTLMFNYLHTVFDMLKTNTHLFSLIEKDGSIYYNLICRL